ncbi:MAG: 50S ribosomal protein L3 [Candidatus Komeilibacteria bacterium CG11_big_fil_rev_8_21_14_0_20_36_20]|uniref:Large ribosomal subunit protein uL3 n=1 Tax=Candidatus Komeilibacteria bacterium CG11_big_fil_rev_8_21_14_0_20_36_20 TaxID=1974477 RepID=A0A2H0NFU9_9BACT|nr:MAG: 50S ribosomal protein L3 [Candidatus Komeilibacteria bacterium CG11_big_fil_rev_8_21_14_0_20_36_20]PIR81406.1 MAG: 50S ribosomal protein L3 [Candidatus Komeilibacteria bacterium CG10_big_fil_rev_8_21_14_0_10_36_65]PJC55131.1 MAG: 50S ribosomal protein L3 [Candidatus Komeilibacteria bacterium CG_4_9_14_0_2_um_filter_36_13]
MAKFILGVKLNMTQKFLENGLVVPVTVVKAGPCTVTQVKGKKDGYQAVQIGFGQKSKLSKSLQGHLKGLSNFRYVREFRVTSTDNIKRGQIFDVTSFKPGDKLKVAAIAKGKGFQGVVRRHGFHGSPATHGHKDQLRMPGSIGATDAARVFKGTRMAGRMGGQKVTLSNLELIEADEKNHLLYIKGAVAGARNTLVSIITDGDLQFIDPANTEAKLEDKKEIKNTDEDEKDAKQSVEKTEKVSEENKEEKDKKEEQTK